MCVLRFRLNIFSEIIWNPENFYSEKSEPDLRHKRQKWALHASQTQTACNNYCCIQFLFDLHAVPFFSSISSIFRQVACSAHFSE